MIQREKLSKYVQERYQFKNETLFRVVKDKPLDRIEIEVGDIKQPDFKPQIKIKRWDNEVNLSVRYKDDIDNRFESPVVESKNKIISYRKNNKEVHFYELDPDSINEDGGYEFEVILNEKPASNIIEFTIETKELDFFYQPALTDEEIKRGAFRPENVIGSYAVYHKTKANNKVGGKEYKTGKAFHIYRPKIIDKNGEWVWGELNINEQSKLLTITIPQEFLDKALYPVIVDPTFGYTTAGASSEVNLYGGLIGSPTTLSEAGIIESMSVATTNSSAYCFAALYDSSKNLLRQTGNLGALSSSFRSGNLTSSYNASAGDYYLIAHQNCNPASIKYDSGTNTGYLDLSPATTCNASYSFPNPGAFALSGGLPSPDNKYSIYATYTASGGTETASVSHISTAFSLPSVTSQQTFTADVLPITVTYTVPNTNATYIQVETATTEHYLLFQNGDDKLFQNGDLAYTHSTDGAEAISIIYTTNESAAFVTNNADVNPVIIYFSSTLFYYLLFQNNDDILFQNGDQVVTHAIQVTATYEVEPLADVTPVLITYIAISVTAQFSVSAQVIPVSVTYTVIQVEAQSGSIGEVVPVSITYSPQALTATYTQIEQADVASLSIQKTIPSITATYKQINNAIVSGVALTFTSQAVTAEGLFVGNISPVTVSLTITPTSPRSSYSASVDAITIQFVISALIAEYDAVITANVLPVSTTYALSATFATYSDSNIGSVEPVVLQMTLSVLEATAQYTTHTTALTLTFTTVEISVNATFTTDVTPLSITLTNPLVTSEYEEIAQANISYVSTTFSVLDVTALSTLYSAGITSIIIEYGANSVTGTYIYVKTADMGPALISFTLPEIALSGIWSNLNKESGNVWSFRDKDEDNNWAMSNKEESDWLYLDKRLDDQYIIFQNEDYILLQNGDILISHEIHPEWDNSSKEDSTWNNTEKVLGDVLFS